MKYIDRLLCAAFVLALTSAPLAANAASFALSATGLADNAMLTKDMAFDKMSSDGVHACGGMNKPPSFAWTNAPAGTQSFAILESDPDGGGGRGVNHLVEYNIPGSASAITSAEIAAGKYTPGRSSGDLVGYRGPCPPIGDAPHHYIVTIYALSSAPALPAGLDRDGVMAAIQKTLLAATTTVLRYQAQP